MANKGTSNVSVKKSTWAARKSPEGWTLGIMVKGKTYHIDGLKFVNKKEIKLMLKQRLLFIDEDGQYEWA